MKMWGWLSAFVLVYCCAAKQVVAQEQTDFPDLSEEMGALPIAAGIDPPPDNGLSWRGFIDARSHYAVRSQTASTAFKRQQPGVTSARLLLWLESDFSMGTIADLRVTGHIAHEAADLDGETDTEALLNEGYVDFYPIGRWRLKVGRQLVALGMSDYFQPLDVVNPRDERILGLVNLRESRLPVLATRLGYQRERNGLELILKHEFRPHRYGDAQSDFDPYIGVGGFDATVGADEPNLYRDPDWVVRAYSSQSWGDLHLIAARIHDPMPIPVDMEAQRLVLGYQQTDVIGAGANYVVGDWVFKSELSRRDAVRQVRGDIAQQIADGDTRPVVSTLTPQVEWMAGARYTGISRVTISSELLAQHSSDYDSGFADPRIRHLGVFNLGWVGYHDKLQVEILYGRWWRGSHVVRTQLRYDLDDQISLNAAYIEYGGGAEGPLDLYRDNDRLVFGLRYSL